MMSYEPQQYIEFNKAAKELREALKTLNSDELENAWKCLGILYLQLDVDEVFRMLAAQRLKYIGNEVIQRQVELEMKEST